MDNDVLQILQERINDLYQRIEELEEETGVAEKRRVAEHRRSTMEMHTNLYLHAGFSKKEAGSLAHADWRNGRDIDSAICLLERKQKEQKEAIEKAAREARTKSVRDICAHLRKMDQSANPEYIALYMKAIKDAHPEEAIREALIYTKRSLADWGYVNE